MSAKGKKIVEKNPVFIGQTGGAIKVKEFQRSFHHSDTKRLSRSDEVLKLKNFKKDALCQAFKCRKIDDKQLCVRFSHALRGTLLTSEETPEGWVLGVRGGEEVDDMLIFDTDQVQVDMTNKFLSSRFSIKDMGEADFTLVSTPMYTSEKLMPNNGQDVSQLEYSRVIGCLMYVMTCTRPYIAFEVGKLSSYPLVLEGYTDASWIINIKDNSSTGGCVFLLGVGAISWAYKKQTCITNSTMEYEFVALAAAGKETEWLRNLVLKIPLWSKPISSISTRCDSVKETEKPNLN
ncbi:hypothetical protein Tco_1328948 [Tanacetum coccineum]